MNKLLLSTAALAALALMSMPGHADNINKNFNNGNAVVYLEESPGRFYFEEDRDNPGMTKGYRQNGALYIKVGGVNDKNAYNMEASWTSDFNSSGSKYTISVDTKLTQSSEYEREEVSRLGIYIGDEHYNLSEVEGNGNGGSSKSKSRTFSKTLYLREGRQSISLTCFNNQKTAKNEHTTCEFDNVEINKVGGDDDGDGDGGEVTPQQCYGIGAKFGEDLAFNFCFTSSDDMGPIERACAGTFKKHTVNGCKSTFIDTLKLLYGDPDGCVNFERYSGNEFRQRLLQEDKCNL